MSSITGVEGHHPGAGIGGEHRALTAEYPDERWHQVMAINLTGVWLCMKYELAQMLTRGGGTIVNTASGQDWWDYRGIVPTSPVSMGS
jgi:NAD(P)-dependent dehydrogenase (short-subunit alcohol dehydrogenase family)